MALTNEQWELYLSKYDKLIWTISRRISGDIATASLEDNYADLCIAALASITAFEKKTGKTFDEMIHEKLFDQYTKTVLWNYKAKKGVPLTKKMPFRNKHVSIYGSHDTNYVHKFYEDQQLALDVPDRTIDFDASSFALNDMFDSTDDDVKKVVGAIMNDPSVLSDEGHLKVYSLIQPTGLGIHAVQKAVEKISRLLKTNYVEE